jgi:formylglycine-generating enzyme required for sulfatase activity
MKDQARKMPPDFADACPVVNVTWFDAIQFANELSKLERLEPYYRVQGTNVEVVDGLGYRLPTEAEWEYACRAGTQDEWYFGNESRKLQAYAWTYYDSKSHPQPVGLKIPNEWGLYDMHGNVWEWCWDWHDSLYFSFSPPKDPQGPNQGVMKVIRGGSCHQGKSSCTSASRARLAPDDASSIVGFRLARCYDASCNPSAP